jgi:signal peptidase II
MRKYQFLIVGAVLLLDRVTKLLVVGQLPVAHGVPIIRGFFQFYHWENTGAAFSMFADAASPWRTFGFVAFSLVACVVISYVLWHHRPALNVSSASLSLILGGALGNVWDRLAKGTVTDFLDFYVGHHHWPTFNLADSAIVAGALLLLSETFWRPQEQNTSKQQIG